MIPKKIDTTGLKNARFIPVTDNQNRERKKNMELWLHINRAGIAKGELFDSFGKVEVADWENLLAEDDSVDIRGVVVTESLPTGQTKTDKTGKTRKVNNYMVQDFEILEGEMLLDGDPYFMDKTFTRANFAKAKAANIPAPTPLADKEPETPETVEAAPQNADDLATKIAIAVAMALKAQG